LLALISENGPFTWQPGTYLPNQNPWAFTNLTNVIWVDQPIGTGFSQGEVTITGYVGLSKQFNGFWKNFIKTFGLQNWKIYVAGESYSGRWVPYIADAMFEANDTTK
jgi:carboxypeptidase D